ncbi:pectate lyase [Marinimicrobium locisalis]|uniref:pectate lyase n=1 Tax=Marinimicrobium locisalis TaxID=546022 RepID=UPI00322187CE
MKAIHFIAALPLALASTHVLSQSCGTCEWYGSDTPACCSQETGWGWENNQSCVGPTECTSNGQNLIGGDSSASSSDAPAPEGQSCDWYGDVFPLCEQQSTGWGWENSQSCIGVDTCESQSGEGGVIDGGSSSSQSSESNSQSSSSSSQPSGGSTLTLQENASGFCQLDGAVESEHSGYTGAGYVNTENAQGVAIQWQVDVPTDGNYSFSFRFANGASDRPGDLAVNGNTLSRVSLPGTGAWGSYSTTNVDNIYLNSGANVITLAASGNSGLANIDRLQVTGFEPTAGDCGGQSSSSSSSSSNNNGDITGSSCTPGNAQVVNETIVIEDGSTFDGQCQTYTAGSSLGDGSQDESQDPVFRVENGSTLRNVVIGNNGADGIHLYNDATLDNIYFQNVGEDAVSIKSEGSFIVRNIEGYDAEDKFFQVNAESSLTVTNCIIHNAGKSLRQNGGTEFPIDVTFEQCDIANMGEGIFRTDSPNSTAFISNSRLRNAGDICIGDWAQCGSSNITQY